jgi:hypothetical protein
MEKYKEIVDFIKTQFSNQHFVPLHAPVFFGNEKKYLMDAIDSTFVSSVGEYVNRFEKMMCEITNAKYAIATVNGTGALHMGLLLSDVKNHRKTKFLDVLAFRSLLVLKRFGRIFFFLE